MKSKLTICILLVAILAAGSIYILRPRGTTIASVPALVVPHHDLVKEQRLELIRTHAAQYQPDTIILISPNHFASGRGSIITTDKIWTIKGGDGSIQPATQLVHALVDADIADIETAAFTGEHGISNLLQEIHALYPQATLVPIIVRETAPVEDIYAAVDLLARQCDSCGVIASVDMSHYQPAHVADIHDRATLRALAEQDLDALQTVEVDSTRSLLFTAYWAQLHDLPRFELHAHTNSGYMVNDTDIETTTHIMGQYVAGEPVAVTDEVTFTVAGDTMFARAIDERFSDSGFIGVFEHFGDRVLWGTDLVWLNLEGVLVEEPETVKSTAAVPLLFSEKAVSALRYLHVNAAGLANNHAFDAGVDGLEYMEEVLESNNILAHGRPDSLEGAVHRVSHGDVTVSFISVYVPGQVSGLTDLIRAESELGAHVVVLPHWGVEYMQYPSPQQRAFAREWVKAGATLILGSHPHVIQPAERIVSEENSREGMVFYSLGNFVFDQAIEEATRTGLIVTGSMQQQGVRLVLSPVESVQLQPRLLRGSEKVDVLDFICADIGGCAEGVVEYQFKE